MSTEIIESLAHQWTSWLEFGEAIPLWDAAAPEYIVVCGRGPVDGLRPLIDRLIRRAQDAGYEQSHGPHYVPALHVWAIAVRCQNGPANEADTRLVTELASEVGFEAPTSKRDQRQRAEAVADLLRPNLAAALAAELPAGEHIVAAYIVGVGSGHWTSCVLLVGRGTVSRHGDRVGRLVEQLREAGLAVLGPADVEEVWRLVLDPAPTDVTGLDGYRLVVQLAEALGFEVVSTRV